MILVYVENVFKYLDVKSMFEIIKLLNDGRHMLLSKKNINFSETNFAMTPESMSPFFFARINSNLTQHLYRQTKVYYNRTNRFYIDLTKK